MALPGRRRRRDRGDTTAHGGDLAAHGGDLAALVRELGLLCAELGLTEVEIERDGLRVRVQRGTVAAAPPGSAPEPAGSPLPTRPVVAHAGLAEGHLPIEAPMVGTFYRASSPGAEPYVRENDVVKPGQVLCIIEAMKLMNEIEAKVGGRVVKVLVENAQPVEYGQPLFLIDTNG